MMLLKNKKGQAVAGVARFASGHVWQIVGGAAGLIFLLVYLLSETAETWVNFAAVFIAFLLVNVIFIAIYYYLIKLAKGILKFKIFAKRIQYYWAMIFK